MAKQKGIIPFVGTIGELTFKQTKNGYIVSSKPRMDAKRIKTDPKFQRTRENMAEFTRAGNATKHVRSAFRSLLRSISDSDMIPRLFKEMMKVIKADKVSPRGLRNVIDGEAELLKGFEFAATHGCGLWWDLYYRHWKFWQCYLRIRRILRGSSERYTGVSMRGATANNSRLRGSNAETAKILTKAAMPCDHRGPSRSLRSKLRKTLRSSRSIAAIAFPKNYQNLPTFNEYQPPGIAIPISSVLTEMMHS